MTEDEFFNRSNDVLNNLSNQGEVSVILTDLNNNFKDVLSQNKSLQDEVNTLKEDRENLRKANMDLFLQVGSKSKENSQQSNINNENEDEKLSYDDLFDEKGMIK